MGCLNALSGIPSKLQLLLGASGGKGQGMCRGSTGKHFKTEGNGKKWEVKGAKPVWLDVHMRTPGDSKTAEKKKRNKKAAGNWGCPGKKITGKKKTSSHLNMGQKEFNFKKGETNSKTPKKEILSRSTRETGTEKTGGSENSSDRTS